MTELMRRRRALMTAQGGDAGPNYIVPSDSAGRGTSVAMFAEGNILKIRTISKGTDNDIRGYFARAISIKSGDVVRVKITRTAGALSSVSALCYVGAFSINAKAVTYSSSANVDVSATAAANYTADYFRIRNSSNARTSTNDAGLVEIFINGEQVI